MRATAAVHHFNLNLSSLTVMIIFDIPLVELTKVWSWQSMICILHHYGYNARRRRGEQAAFPGFVWLIHSDLLLLTESH